MMAYEDLAGKTHKSYAKTFIIYYRKASGRSVVKAFKKANTFTRLPFADKRFFEDLQQTFISLELFIFWLWFS
ncbi:hypothetical protein PBAC_29040 [Pedobacter glucosidilyticus]|nr:hypothetical protein PBAC_29040 [Pedobacter glucosidilyticus]